MTRSYEIFYGSRIFHKSVYKINITFIFKMKHILIYHN